MKIKCIQDHWPEVKGGILGIGAKPRTKIDGLTEGNTYEAQVVSFVTGAIVSGACVTTTFHFLIYNDNNQWVDYQLNLFEPI